MVIPKLARRHFTFFILNQLPGHAINIAHENSGDLHKSTQDDDVIKWNPFPRHWPFVRGIHRSGVFPAQRPVTRSFDVFFHLCLNKRLSKQPRGWWFETPPWSLWRQCNENDPQPGPLFFGGLKRIEGACLPRFHSGLHTRTNLMKDSIRTWFHLAKQSPQLQWRHNGRDSVLNHQSHDCLLNGLFRRRSKKTWKLRVTGLCAGNSPGTGEFPAQMASNAENVSIWWRHHGWGNKMAATFQKTACTIMFFWRLPHLYCPTEVHPEITRTSALVWIMTCCLLRTRPLNQWWRGHQ